VLTINTVGRLRPGGEAFNRNLPTGIRRRGSPKPQKKKRGTPSLSPPAARLRTLLCDGQGKEAAARPRGRSLGNLAHAPIDSESPEVPPELLADQLELPNDLANREPFVNIHEPINDPVTPNVNTADARSTSSRESHPSDHLRPLLAADTHLKTPPLDRLPHSLTSPVRVQLLPIKGHTVSRYSGDLPGCRASGPRLPAGAPRTPCSRVDLVPPAGGRRRETQRARETVEQPGRTRRVALRRVLADVDADTPSRLRPGDLTTAETPSSGPLREVEEPPREIEQNIIIKLPLLGELPLGPPPAGEINPPRLRETIDEPRDITAGVHRIPASFTRRRTLAGRGRIPRDASWQVRRWVVNHHNKKHTRTSGLNSLKLRNKTTGRIRRKLANADRVGPRAATILFDGEHASARKPTGER